MKKGLLLLLLLSMLVLACQESVQDSPESKPGIEGGPEEHNELKVNWLDSELTDVTTGNTFKISEFDKPVLVESFAVWCPTCTKQQREMKSLHEHLGDTFISVSLDTDPNEDEARVRDHLKKNGFNWLYAVSPKEVTESLIDEFGVGVVNAPSAPVIIICKGESRMLENGLKKWDELEGELEKC